MTAIEAILPPYIDSTMMSAFRSCPQKYYAEFVLGLRPIETSVDLHFGGVVSSGLETFYRGIYEEGLDSNTALARAYSRYDTEWGNFDPVRKTAKTRDNCWAAIEDYIRIYPPASDHIQPYLLEGKPSVEFSFAIPLEPLSDDETEGGFPLHPVTNEPWLLAGRFDMLGKYLGRTAIRDEKTAGKLETTWSDKWNLRSQFLGYCWAMQQSGIPCDTVIVRGIIVTKEIRQVEAIKLYPQHLIDRWHEQFRRDLWRLRRAWDEEYFDFNLNESCTAYGICHFMDRCTSKDTNMWNSTYKVSRWNPLAKNPIDTPLPSPTAAKLASLGVPLPTHLLSEIVSTA